MCSVALLLAAKKRLRQSAPAKSTEFARNVLSSNGRYSSSAVPRVRQASANSRSPPQAPLQIARSLELAATSGEASSLAISSATTPSLLAEKRRALPPGASSYRPLSRHYL